MSDGPAGTLPAYDLAGGPRPAPAEDWHRLHPLTPLLRGGRVLAVLLVFLVRQAEQEIGVGRSGLVLAAALPLAAAYGLLSWRFTRYRIAGGSLRLETGVLLRRSRQVPLERLQAVDLIRGLVARPLGLAELRLEVVGQGRTEAPLAYLTLRDAQLLRARLLALGSGADPGGAAVGEQVLVRVPPGVLLASIALSGPVLVVPALLLLLAGITALVGLLLAPPVLRSTVAITAALLPALLTAGGVALHRLVTEYGFTVADAPDGLRLRHGLFATRAQTIPAGRVQAVRVLAPVLWRWKGWVRVEVDVAGYGTGREEQTQTNALLPVASRALAAAVVGRVLDGVDLDRLQPLPPPRRARLRAPLQRYLGLAWDERYAVTSYGRLRRTIEITPHARVQSLRLVQGPWQRRLRLATLHLDTAGRFVHAAARQRDEGEARRLLEEGALLARLARTAGP